VGIIKGGGERLVREGGNGGRDVYGVMRDRWRERKRKKALNQLKASSLHLSLDPERW
jgi:hypothetical protein